MMHWASLYIGRPWVSGGAGPEAYDCYGLVRAVYRDRLGIDVPLVDYDALSLMSCAHAFRHVDYGRYDRVESPRELDVVQMSQAVRPHHVGLWLEIDGGGVLASVEPFGVVFQNRAALRLAGWNITDLYRPKPH